MPLITDSYKHQQKLLHDTGLYGAMGDSPYGAMVATIINNMEIGHVLDYGCGSRLSLAHSLQGKVQRAFKYQPYDPCVQKYASAPVPAEMVCCLDVLEHIEEGCIDDVLDHLQALTESIGFFSIDTGPAKKVMEDGRNAHVLQRPPEWWLPRIMARFDLQHFQVVWTEGEHKKFFVIVHPRGVVESVDGGKLS
jgi:hypothetical protein